MCVDDQIMSRMRKILLASGAVIALGAASPPEDRLPETFAGCVGRMSAEMEHAWLLAQEDAAHIAAERASFLSLLEAVSDQDDGRRLLAYRIETKMAHAALLTSAHFAQDIERAERAKQTAQKHLKTCRHLLLGA